MSSDNVTRIMNECSNHSGTRHPNVVRLYHFFQDEQHFYLVMEYCSNRDMRHYMNRLQRPLTESEACRFFRQIVLALYHMHKLGIVHRDVSMSNILLDAKLNVKLSDFGLSKRLDPDRAGDTDANNSAYATRLQNTNRQSNKHYTICGQPNVIAPEVLARKSYGYEVDIWGLGILLHSMLAGSPPFDADDVDTIFQNIRKGSYRLPPTVSKYAADLLSCMLQKDPSKRITLDGIFRHPFLQHDDRTSSSDMYDWRKSPLFIEPMPHAAQPVLYAKQKEKKTPSLTACGDVDGGLRKPPYNSTSSSSKSRQHRRHHNNRNDRATSRSASEHRGSNFNDSGLEISHSATTGGTPSSPPKTAAAATALSLRDMHISGLEDRFVHSRTRPSPSSQNHCSPKNSHDNFSALSIADMQSHQYPYYPSLSAYSSPSSRNDAAAVAAVNISRATTTASDAHALPVERIDTARLRPIRLRLKHCIASIQPETTNFISCCCYLEFFSSMGRHLCSGDLARISSDGATVDLGAIPADANWDPIAKQEPYKLTSFQRFTYSDIFPKSTTSTVELTPPHSWRGAATSSSSSSQSAVHLQEIKPKLRKLYLVAARFVNLLKTKTPKVTIHAASMSCYLMESGDVEVRANLGDKICITNLSPISSPPPTEPASSGNDALLNNTSSSMVLFRDAIVCWAALGPHSAADNTSHNNGGDNDAATGWPIAHVAARASEVGRLHLWEEARLTSLHCIKMHALLDREIIMPSNSHAASTGPQQQPAAAVMFPVCFGRQSVQQSPQEHLQQQHNHRVVDEVRQPILSPASTIRETTTLDSEQRRARRHSPAIDEIKRGIRERHYSPSPSSSYFAGVQPARHLSLSDGTHDYERLSLSSFTTEANGNGRRRKSVADYSIGDYADNNHNNIRLFGNDDRASLMTSLVVSRPSQQQQQFVVSSLNTSYSVWS